MANKTSKRDAMYDAFKGIRKPMAPPTKIFKSREDSEKYRNNWKKEEVDMTTFWEMFPDCDENCGCSGA